MSTRRLLGILRVIFLGLTLACLATRIVWTQKPEWIDRADGWIVGTAHGGVRGILTEADQAIEAKRYDEALELLLRFEDKTKDTGRGDRRSNNRVHGLTLLTAEYERRGEFESALKWSDTLHRFDDRYVPNELIRARLLGKVGRNKESLAILEMLTDLGASNRDIPMALLDRYRALGMTEEAIQLLDRLGEQSPLARPLKEWEVRWRAADGTWQPRTRIDFAPLAEASDSGASSSGRVAFRFELPEPGTALKEFRFDAPRASSFRLQGIAVDLITKDGMRTSVAQDRIVASPGVELLDGTWIGSGAIDPYVTYSLEAPVGSAAIEIAADLTGRIDDELQAFLGSDLAREVTDRLADTLSPALLASLRAIQSR